MSEIVVVAEENAKPFLKQDLTASFIAGGVSGAFSRTVVSPFERAKILFQVQGPGAGNYQGIFSTIYNMWKEEGAAGLFRGNGINCVRVFPYQAVQFVTFQYLKTEILTHHNDSTIDQLTTVERLGAGAIAGTISVLATYPMDLVRTRLSIQTAQNLAKLKQSKINLTVVKPPGFWQLFGKVYATEGGLLGLYRGFYPTTLGVAPYVAINFAVYEKMKDLWPDNTNPLMNLANGALAGGTAQTITYPFDLLRRRFQVLTMGNNELGFQYTSVWNALVTIGKKEGFKGYYKGLTANLFKVIPSMAVGWLTFETVKDAIVNY
ncbi:Mrx21 protein [Saccharomycopsis crataegensis]|uniref:Mrx21 protein n=1 Tax=Saccharomycopsis crataegensis TaxID=43959 RepID=A0AAV5QDM4_9ASCO|nr:Mrx21 protein [Saccharomycopsis crataegensis]